MRANLVSRFLERLSTPARRFFTGSFAVFFLLALISQVLPSTAGATGGQITSRSIQMSTSAPSTYASYKITFTPATSEASGVSVAIDFCSDTPIDGTTCAFSAATVPTVSAGLTASSSTGNTPGTVGVLGTGSPIHTIYLDTIGGTWTAGTAVSFTLNAGLASNLVNPTSVTGFYARITTYSTNTGASSGSTTGYVPANTTGGTTQEGTLAVDTGGIALSTAATIQINSKVFETLAFCVYLSNASCGTAPTFNLGDPTTDALSAASTYIAAGTSSSADGAAFSLSTNASHGATVTMTGTTLCRAAVINTTNCLTSTQGSPTNVINAIGPTSTVESKGTSQFGMCVNASWATVPPLYTDTSSNACNFTSLTNNVYTPTSNYPYFGFDDTSTTGTNSAFGSTIASTTVPVSSSVGYLSFLGNISNLTPSGIYQSDLNLVATGTF